MKNKPDITGIQGCFELHNGVQMPYLGLGTYQSDNDQEVVDAIKGALQLGYRHIDTASAYKNEELKAFEESLNRLGLDYLDLYLIHWPVTGKYKETWRALEYLYAQKKIRAIGVSNFLKHHLEDLMEDCTIVPMVNQMEFHPLLVQQNLIDFCNEQSIQYESWSPFMQGKVFTLDICNDLAKKYKKSVAQIILRWNLQKGVIAIPKSVHIDRIRSNANIFDFELSEEDINYLNSLENGQRSGPDPDNFNF